MLFTEIVLTIVLASLLGILMILLKQPSILGYILAGVVIAAAGFVSNESLDVVSALSSIGIAFLLFMVGLEMNLEKIRHLGKDIVLLGILQTVFIVAAGFGVSRLLGFGATPAVYLAFGLSFSSTIIVVKLLSEKKDLNSLYGRLVVGSMVFEDFLAILMLIFLEGVGASSGAFGFGGDFIITILKGLVLFGATIVLSRFMPKALDFFGGKSEMLFLFSLAWGLGIAALMDLPIIGLGIVIGGFLAGLSLASSAEHYEISGKIRWIRDLFILLFFVVLGAQMSLELNWEVLLRASVFSGFVLVISPIISMFIMSLLGYKSRTAFFASLSTAQISEFSLVVAMKGFNLGHLTQNDVSVMIIVAAVTIVGSSYYVMHGDRLYAFFKRSLKLLEFRKSREGGAFIEEYKDHIVLIGGHRLGENIIKALVDIGEDFVIIDFDPQIIKILRSRGLAVIYGDIAEDDVREAAGFSKARLVISTAPSFEDNVVILETARRDNPRTRVILRAESDLDARDLYDLGADYVLLPYFLGGEYLGRMLEDDKSCRRLAAVKKRDLELLKDRCP
ncbi:MAG: cation:proton antiporter [Patescibacteria group bacterium]|nr:cation:proton antiporter [Patescibacteria group bacterium]MCL5262143.1 cation:proton antiporter [Patescibacteria group bacterium]